jgi:hypothetical protein
MDGREGGREGRKWLDSLGSVNLPWVALAFSPPFTHTHTPKKISPPPPPPYSCSRTWRAWGRWRRCA